VLEEGGGEGEVDSGVRFLWVVARKA